MGEGKGLCQRGLCLKQITHKMRQEPRHGWVSGGWDHTLTGTDYLCCGVGSPFVSMLLLLVNKEAAFSQ